MAVFPNFIRREVMAMVDTESLKGLVNALKAEAAQSTDVLRSIKGAPPMMTPKERIEKTERALVGAGVILELNPELSVLEGVAEETRRWLEDYRARRN